MDWLNAIDFLQLVYLCLLLLASGLAAGFLAGLFGVGGGIILVPVLDQLFVLFGVDSEVSIDMAVATSLASIIFSSIASARAHRRQGNIDWALIRRWAIWVVVGAVLGYGLVKLLNGDLVRLAFACVAILVAGWLILAPPRLVLSTEPPFGWVGRGWASLVGMLSALLGIGGGVLAVPLLTLYAYPSQRATGTSAAIGFFIAAPATATAIILGLRSEVERPFLSLGEVNLIALVILIPMTMISAPWGAALGQRLSSLTLRRIFGLFMLLVATRMILAASGAI